MTEFNLHRTVKPNQLKTKSVCPKAEYAITLDEIFGGALPPLLGSFRLDIDDGKEVKLLNEDETVMKKIPKNFNSPHCKVRRVSTGGISCSNVYNHKDNDVIKPLPLVGEDTTCDEWYFLEAGAIAENNEVNEYLQDDIPEFRYNDLKCTVFLSFNLPSGTQIPANYECVFDNDPEGHHTIRRSNDEVFNAELIKIDNFCYAMVQELVNMGWQFEGLQIKASAEPIEFRDSFDKDTWQLAVIIYDYFCLLSTKELINDASTVLSVLSKADYTRASCTNSEIRNMLMRVINEICLYCDAQEINFLHKFKREFNGAVQNIFGPILSIEGNQVNDDAIIHSGTFWCSLFHKLGFKTFDYNIHMQQTLSEESIRLQKYIRKLNCENSPPNVILNALTYKFTLYCLQDTADQVFESIKKGDSSTDTTLKDEVLEATEKKDDIESLEEPYPLVSTVFIQRVSKNRLGWYCAVCLGRCKMGDTWFTLYNCGHKFHVDCIGQWLYKKNGRNCPICRVNVCEPPTQYLASKEMDKELNAISVKEMLDNNTQNPFINVI